MSDTKISGLNVLLGSGVDGAADVLPIVDTSATETKQITVEELVKTPGLVPVTLVCIVGDLPAAATAGAGARAFVTDATATTFHSTVAGTGANKVPVVSDGTNWLIG